MCMACHWDGNYFESRSQRRVRPYGLQSNFSCWTIKLKNQSKKPDLTILKNDELMGI